MMTTVTIISAVCSNLPQSESKCLEMPYIFAIIYDIIIFGRSYLYKIFIFIYEAAQHWNSYTT